MDSGRLRLLFLPNDGDDLRVLVAGLLGEENPGTELVSNLEREGGNSGEGDSSSSRERKREEVWEDKERKYGVRSEVRVQKGRRKEMLKPLS